MDERRLAENLTIGIIRELLDLDVLDTSNNRAVPFPAGQHGGSCA